MEVDNGLEAKGYCLGNPFVRLQSIYYMVNYLFHLITHMILHDMAMVCRTEAD